MASSNKSDVINALDKINEFEKEPVSKDKLQPGRYFAGLLAGEHVAGTEFVIGALFVAWGVTAFDIFVGLILGNLMAVLTWTLVCAPIATRTRLTLYWYLRKIAGPDATMLYNILNAVLFCILAGCMITVSASAVRIPFGIPAQTNWYPESFGFVLIVLAVGAVVVALAILGFKSLAKFASVCSPWMFLMFMGGALVMLPGLAASEDVIAKIGKIDVHTFSGFWALANGIIWTGQLPADSTLDAPMSFWQVAAFAWICNLAMHGGLSDMAVFRYARKTSYGLYSAFGMFFGHYLAWIFAGVMGAATATILKQSIGDLDAGRVAMEALGVTGAIAVVIAGWTTSNPTLYRAGLAFQAATPGWPRWRVTMLVGAATTVIACFPFVFTKLLDFVGWYGLLLMPVGAIVFVEHWIFPRIGLKQYWVSRKNLSLSWPALASWFIGIGAALILESSGAIHLFYLFVPIWVLTAVLYIVFTSIALPPLAATPDVQIEEDEVIVKSDGEASKETAVKPAAAATMSPLSMAMGAVAVLCLLYCLIMPLRIFFSSPETYQERLNAFLRPDAQLLSPLLWVTLVYFVTATTYSIHRDKSNA